MPINALFSEFHAIAGMPESGILAVPVGTLVSLAPLQSIAVTTTTLSRKPAGSTATISANAFTPDLPSLYLANNSVAGIPGLRNFIIGAFPVSTLSLRVAPGNPNSALVSLTTLQQLMADARVSFNGYSRLIAALEASPPTLVGITGTSGAPAWSDWSNA